MKRSKQDELFSPGTIPSNVGNQLCLLDLAVEAARKKIAPLSIDYSSPNQKARATLETKYRALLTDRLDFRQLVTYVLRAQQNHSSLQLVQIQRRIFAATGGRVGKAVRVGKGGPCPGSVRRMRHNAADLQGTGLALHRVRCPFHFSVCGQRKAHGLA